MGWFEWLAQLAVAALLCGTIPVALRLERALREVRRDRDTLEGCARGLDEASRRAEAASAKLRRDTEEGFRASGEGRAAAEALRDDLRYLVGRAEAAADRLEELVRAARTGPGGPVAAAAVPASAPPRPVESRAERDLLVALARRAS